MGSINSNKLPVFMGDPSVGAGLPGRANSTMPGETGTETGT